MTWRSRLRQAASRASLVGGSFLKIRPIQCPPVRRNFEKRGVELDERILDSSVLVVAGVAGRIRWEGYSKGRVLASYVHAHWASTPALAAAFVTACDR